MERVRTDGTLVWSSPLTTLLGDPGFEPHVLEARHAHLQDDGKALLVVVQGLAASLTRPADKVAARFVTIDSASGRVLRRADIARPFD